MNAEARFAVPLAILALVTACATGDAQRGDPGVLSIDGLSFENRARTALTSIRLQATETNRFVSCGHIAPGGVCASTFPGVAWRGGGLVVSWVQDGNEWNTGEITPDIDERIASAGRAELKVVVVAPGSAGVVLVSSRSDGLLSDP